MWQLLVVTEKDVLVLGVCLLFWCTLGVKSHLELKMFLIKDVHKANELVRSAKPLAYWQLLAKQESNVLVGHPP